jgi:hypothetical protein
MWVIGVDTLGFDSICKVFWSVEVTVVVLGIE